MPRPLAVATALLLLPAAAKPAAAEVRLLMIEAPGCPWCARRDAEVGDAYAGTPEGRSAPLVRTDIRALPEDPSLSAPAVFMPTFVLLRHGAEAGRIDGYAGEDFFWPLPGRPVAAAAGLGRGGRAGGAGGLRRHEPAFRTVAGVMAAAFAGSLVLGRFRWEACADPRELGRQIGGAALMGVGGVVALRGQRTRSRPRPEGGCRSGRRAGRRAA